MTNHLDPEFQRKLQILKYPRFVETHYHLRCPQCMKLCHTLYVIGKHPNDKLGCLDCYERETEIGRMAPNEAP